MMKIVQDQTYRGKDWWDWSVWLEGRDKELDAVEEVVWRLSPTFTPSKVTQRNRAERFRLSTSGWGGFHIVAELTLKSGGVQRLTHELELLYPKYVAVKGSLHPHPEDCRQLGPTANSDRLTLTLLLRRKPGSKARIVAVNAPRPTREEFASAEGADPNELKQVAAFAAGFGLEVAEADQIRRSLVLRGSAADVKSAFAVQLNDFQYAHGRYRSHDGPVHIPSSIAEYVEAVVGLTDRPVRARHFSTVSRVSGPDPAKGNLLSPRQVASLYNFPPGDGAGQTIAIFEMETNKGPAGYSLKDIAATMSALGGPMPNIVEVPVDGVGNSGQSDGEISLDITVAGAIAPKATIAVYFTGGQAQNIISGLQAMIHPLPGQPVPTIILIGYGWGPDDGSRSFSQSELGQISRLFQDAATNKITVLVSSGNSGAQILDPRQAQTSYPASDAWVTACGGTAIGNVNGSSFEERAWNDAGGASPGATGGGVSALFVVPAYQSSAPIPRRIGTAQPGRGVPDIAGHASANAGYLQVVKGGAASGGGTGAAAALYAGLIARINANLGLSVGFLNPTLYSVPPSTFRDIVVGNNSFDQVTGYVAGPGWDACTGLGSVVGQALQDRLAAIVKGAPRSKQRV